MLLTGIVIALVLLGWFPFFYGRFRGDGKARGLFRAALWGLFMIVPMSIISEITHRLPAPLVYPLAFMAAPALVNICALLTYIFRLPRKAG
jgi:hypothetical protein